tara:strand:- start:259 stop:1029 length:771 start_codon:yes stop_codon:yes gene_type:complete
MAVFVPVIYMLGGMALRATTAAIAKRVAAAGGKKIAGKTTKKIVNATKTNIDKAVKAAKDAPKRGGKNPRDRKGRYTGYKPPVTQGSRTVAKKPSTAVTRPSSTSVTTKPSGGARRPMKDVTPKPKQITGPKTTAKKKSKTGLIIGIFGAGAGIGTLLGGRDEKPVVPTKKTIDITDSIPQERKKTKTKTKPSMSFGDAFKKAYDGGKGRGKTFTHDGKKYIAITKDDLNRMGGSGYTLKDYIKDSKRTPGKKYKK